MAKLEVCSCCAIKEPHIAQALERLKAEYGDKLEVVPRQCLDVCAENGAVKVGGQIMTVAEGDVTEFERRVRDAMAAE